ncbi:MAG: M20/M25/M40 family metallo-hydrolase [Elusimicrobiota bacterium]|jgi:acetylornithine deacetylase/succinyl-diaminopimelate desuccinylase-like protein
MLPFSAWSALTRIALLSLLSGNASAQNATLSHPTAIVLPASVNSAALLAPESAMMGSLPAAWTARTDMPFASGLLPSGIFPQFAASFDPAQTTALPSEIFLKPVEAPLDQARTGNPIAAAKKGDGLFASFRQPRQSAKNLGVLQGLSSSLRMKEPSALDSSFDNARPKPTLDETSVLAQTQPPASERRTALRKEHARALAPELAALLKALVSAPSVNGVNPEKNVADLLQEFALAHGMRVERFEASPGRPVLKISVGPEDVPGLLIVGHMDTVPVGDESVWKHPPFAADIEDGKLYGRGALDDKGGIVAAMGALLKVQKLSPRRCLSLLAVPDEEAGATGDLGIKLLHAKGKLQGLGAIYAYSGNDNITVGHRGVWRFRVRVRGKGKHTGSHQWQEEQGLGANALTGAARIMLALEDLSKELLSKRGSGLYAPYATVLTPVILHGGQSYGLTPDDVQLQVDSRLIPDLPVEELRAKVEALLADFSREHPALKVEWAQEYYIPPSQADPAAPVVSAVRAAARKILGKVLPLKIAGPANESYILNGFGIPTVIIGPTGENFHGPDEYVNLNSIEAASRIYAQAWKLLRGV